MQDSFILMKGYPQKSKILKGWAFDGISEIFGLNIVTSFNVIPWKYWRGGQRYSLNKPFNLTL